MRLLKLKFLLFFLVVMGSMSVLAEIYQWTDEHGKTHYSDEKPDSQEADKVDIEPTNVTPSTPYTEKEPTSSDLKSQRPRSLPLDELGPLPESTSSQYVETLSSGVIVSGYTKGIARFSIGLEAKHGLPSGAYLEAHFENPLNPLNPLIVGDVRRGTQDVVIIGSPKIQGITCWNYQVEVFVYRGPSKTKLLEIHRQTIQSRINFNKIKSIDDFLNAASQSNCP